MPSPAAAAAAANHHDLFDEDTEEDMEDDSEVDEGEAALVRGDLNSSSSDDDDDQHPQNPSADPDSRNPVKLEASSAPAVPINNGVAIQVTPISSAGPAAAEGEDFGASEAKLQRVEGRKVLGALGGGDDSRRLFQRLWTDEDEIAILQGFYEFTSQRGTTHHAHQHDTGPFYDQIRTRLQLDFNKNQLVEKLRRLKKKYKNIMSRMGARKDFAFKNPHDRETFEISRKIWSNSIGRRDDDDDHVHVFNKKAQRMRRRGRKRSVAVVAVIDAAAAVVPVEVKALPVVTAVPVEVKAVPSLATSTVKTAAATVTPATVAPPSTVTTNSVQETVRSCFSPLFKELVHSAVTGPLTPGIGGGAPLTFSSVPLSFAVCSGNLPPGAGEKTAAIAEKWRKQHILELEVYSKRLELVQEQIKLALKELRSLER